MVVFSTESARTKTPSCSPQPYNPGKDPTAGSPVPDLPAPVGSDYPRALHRHGNRLAIAAVRGEKPTFWVASTLTPPLIPELILSILK